MSSYCKCEHSIRDHEWNFTGKPQPCTRCGCTDFREMTDEEEDALMARWTEQEEDE